MAGSEAGKPGGQGWRPSEDDVRRAAEAPESHLLLRVVSVIPFMFAGAVGVIAFVAWIAVIILGVGTGRGTVWQWASGRPAGEVIAQVALALLIGVASAAVVALSIYATGYGFRTRQPRYFWAIAQAVFGGLAILLALGKSFAPGVMREIGLTGSEWWFALAIVGFAIVVMGMRMRRAGDDLGDARRERATGRDHDTDGDHG